MKRNLKKNSIDTSKVKALLTSLDEHIKDLDENTMDIMGIFNYISKQNLTESERNEIACAIENSIENTQGEL